MAHMSRPPIPEADRRTALMRVRVRQSAADKFAEVAAERGMSLADAHREALAQWINRKDPK